MILETQKIIRIETPALKEVLAYGSSGNDDFDRAAVNMLYATGELITKTDMLDRIEQQEGTVPGSDYSKRPLGRIEVVGYDKGLKDCRIQHVTIREGGVSEHPHPEGEWYLIPEDGSMGVLALGEGGLEKYLLEESVFYHVKPGIDHALHPFATSQGGKNQISVLVFKFSPELIRDFREGYKLQPNLPE
jgi:hypothetical protein